MQQRAVNEITQRSSLSAGYFLLLGQKKVTKEKATLFAAPSECPALLTKPSGCATRAARSDSARRLPSAWLRYSAAQKGARKNAFLNGAVVTYWEKARSAETCQLIFTQG